MTVEELRDALARHDPRDEVDLVREQRTGELQLRVGAGIVARFSRVGLR